MSSEARSSSLLEKILLIGGGLLIFGSLLACTVVAVLFESEYDATRAAAGLLSAQEQYETLQAEWHDRTRATLRHALWFGNGCLLLILRKTIQIQSNQQK